MRFDEFIETTNIEETGDWLKEWRPEAGIHMVAVTGQLAEKGLTRILEAIDPEDFTYEIRVFDVAVAAWISTDMIREQVGDLEGVDLILTPGKLMGDEDELARELDRPIVRGPECYSELPTFLEVEDFERITDLDLVKPRLAIIGSKQQRLRYGRLLAKTYESPFLTQRNMLMSARENGEKIGELVYDFRSKGEDVPPNLTASLVNSRLMEDDAAGFVLADYPITPRDAQWIDDLSIILDAVIHLDNGSPIDEELISYYNEQAKLVTVDTRGGGRAVIARLLETVESLLNTCVLPTEEPQ